MKKFQPFGVVGFAFLTAIILAVCSYIYDCFYDYSNAIGNVGYLGLYLLTYMIFHFWFIGIVVLSYYLVFKNLTNKYFLILKVLFIVFIGWGLAVYQSPDEWSLSHNQEVKYKIVYILAGLISMFLYERQRLRLAKTGGDAYAAFRR